MNVKARSLAMAALIGAGAYGLGLLVGQGVSHPGHPAGSKERAALTTGARPRAPATALEAVKQLEDGSSRFLAPPEALRGFEANLRGGRLDRYVGYWWSGYTQLMPLVGVFSTNEFPKAWRLLDAQPAELRGPLRQALAYFWSRSDSRAALAAALVLPAGHDRDDLVQSILANWGRNEPQAALAAARQMPAGPRRDTALQSVITGLAVQDPAAAVLLLTNLPPGQPLDLAQFIVCCRLAPQDPDAAAALLARAGPTYRGTCLRSVTRAKAARSFPEAVIWAQTLSAPAEREAALGEAAGQWAETDPAKAAEWIISQPEGKARERMASSLIWTWAYKDGPAAAAWVLALPEGPFRKKALGDLGASWSNQDPQEVADFIMKSLPPGEERANSLKDLAQRWTGQGETARDALAWANGLPAGPERDAFLAGVCALMPHSDPEGAVRIALSMSAGEEQALIVRDAVPSWLGKDPEGAKALCAALPQGPARSAALATILQEWGREDPVAASQWLQALPLDDGDPLPAAREGQLRYRGRERVPGSAEANRGLAGRSSGADSHSQAEFPRDRVFQRLDRTVNSAAQGSSTACSPRPCTEHSALQKHRLLGAWLAQARDPKTEQPQRMRHELLPAQEETAQPVNLAGLGQRVFHGDLARERREVAVAHLHLDRVRPQMAVLEPVGDVLGLLAQAGAEHFPAVGVLQEGLLAADALDFLSLRAEPARRGAGHGRMHAELPRLVAGRAEHAALGWRRADNDRLAAQRRIVALLHRRVNAPTCQHVSLFELSGLP